MKIIKEVLNVFIGLAAMISLLVGLPSIFAALKGHTQDLVNAVLSNSILIGWLVLAYFLNKPNSNQVLHKFYNAKWLTTLSTLGVTVVCLPAFFVTDLLIGLSVSFGVLVLVLKFVVAPLWHCPACQAKLPYLKRGKSGFSIKECPSCETLLSRP